MMLPFWWMLVTSVRLPEEVYAFPPDLWPEVWHWENYAAVLAAAPFYRYFLNTLIVAVVITTGNLLFSAMAGYAFARLSFPGRDLIFWLFLASMMIPGQVTMIPVFVLMVKLGWIDTYLGLTVPGLVGAYGIFLTRQYFLNLPRDLENAARIEGASEWQIFWHVALPLARPVLTVLGVFTFMGAWTDFLWPLLMTNSKHMRTLEVGLSVFKTQYTVNWPLQMAASLLIMLPVIALFIATQRYFTKGIVLTGMKG
ncbi:carbohydrate ABC transporter permease [bacterium]|nr:carbohydrate ABC transporter permease [bacterium]